MRTTYTSTGRSSHGLGRLARRKAGLRQICRRRFAMSGSHARVERGRRRFPRSTRAWLQSDEDISNRPWHISKPTAPPKRTPSEPSPRLAGGFSCAFSDQPARAAKTPSPGGFAALESYSVTCAHGARILRVRLGAEGDESNYGGEARRKRHA